MNTYLPLKLSQTKLTGGVLACGLAPRVKPAGFEGPDHLRPQLDQGPASSCLLQGLLSAKRLFCREEWARPPPPPLLPLDRPCI